MFIAYNFPLRELDSKQRENEQSTTHTLKFKTLISEAYPFRDAVVPSFRQMF